MKKIVSTNPNLSELELSLTPIQRLKLNPLQCPLSGEKFYDPVTIESGYTFERESLTRHFEKSHICPITGAKISNSAILIPNINVKNMAEKKSDFSGADFFGNDFCPILFSQMKNPFSLISGKSCEKENVLKWLAINPSCPETKIPQNISIIPNHTLREVIKKYTTEAARKAIEKIESTPIAMAIIDPPFKRNTVDSTDAVSDFLWGSIIDHLPWPSNSNQRRRLFISSEERLARYDNYLQRIGSRRIVPENHFEVENNESSSNETDRFQDNLRIQEEEVPIGNVRHEVPTLSSDDELNNLRPGIEVAPHVANDNIPNNDVIVRRSFFLGGIIRFFCRVNN